MFTDPSARTPLLLVAGLREPQVAEAAEAARRRDPAGTALVHADLRSVAEGVVRRQVRHGDHHDNQVLELAHGCVSCTVREDLLPLLRRLAAAPDVHRIVVQLDPSLEPEAISWALRHVQVDGRALLSDVEVEAVLTTVDLGTWLPDSTGDEELAERGLGGSADDERTVAQVAVGQAEFADAIVLAGTAEDRWQQVRTEAVLARLTPSAPLARLDDLDVSDLLERVPDGSRRGEVDGPHGRLLRGQPSLDTDAGVSAVLFEERRPFHPKRLHEAIDLLLEGVVRTRGRFWVASQPDDALYLESAGGGLGIAHAGPWLATVDDWQGLPDDRRLRAELIWDDYYGDRMNELVVLSCDADPHLIVHVLREAVLTDDELAAGEHAWAQYPDPFADWRDERCAESELRENR
ncbi:cobalamin biosynthesis protein CobW [Saccharopolyspora rhizosphaerae]|uniref:Cobalamin biosynthesis protein CobW n=1 Tax=Saccharopolyspora rhizosphaerae TaxID=2492662 RepID=A0A3R8R164_9PSEU|nr:cobalamin biosynthesis protein CobW [Saccharopolyspora rhizosphaerae]